MASTNSIENDREMAMMDVHPVDEPVGFTLPIRHPSEKTEGSTSDGDGTEDNFEASASDDESMFNMFTGEVHDSNSQDNLIMNDARSDASWEDVEEHEHARFDIDVRMSGRDFIRIPTTAYSIPPVNNPKSIRELNAEATEPYKWEPLADETTYRLLDLLPAKDPNEPIQGQIKIQKDDRVNYRAISCCLDGSAQRNATSKHTKSFPCNGKLIHVSSTVYDMLHNIRNLLDQGTWTECGIRPCVWVDVIGLNPADEKEQDDYMCRAANIFRQSQGTIIYFESDAHNVDAVFRVADALMDVFKNDPSDEIAWPEGTLTQDATITTLRGLFSHDWFRQRGSVQEFAANKRRTVVCEKSTVRFEHLFKLITHLDLVSESGVFERAPRFDNLWPNTWLFANLYRYRDSVPRSPGNLDALVVPLLSVSCGCSSLHPLQRCGRRYCGVRARSAPLSPSDSPTALALTFARQASVPAVLALALSFRGTSPHPSWVPDWTHGHQHDAHGDASPPSLPPATRSMLDAALLSSSLPGRKLLLSRSEDEIWTFELPTEDDEHDPDAYGTSRPGTVEGMFVSGVVETGVLRVKGFLLERPAPGTHMRPADIDWTRETMHRGVKRRPRTDRERAAVDWRTEQVRTLYARGERIRVLETEAGWGDCTDDEVVLFVPICELMFVLQGDGHGAYRLVRFLKRTATVDKPRFVFVDREKGEVWGYGDLKRRVHVLNLV